VNPNPFSRWVKELFSKDVAAKMVKTKSTSRRLDCEQLEDRVVPATIITIMAGVAGSGSLDSFLSTIDGTINATDSAGLAGSISQGALQTVGAGIQISITAETSITFDAALTTPVALLTNAGNSAQFIALNGNITFNDTSDTLTTAGGSLSLLANGALTLGNLASANGDINLRANTVAIVGTVNAGNTGAGGIVTVRQFTDGTNIDLGTETGGKVSLTNTELNQITARVLRIGSNTAGTIVVSSAITLGANVPTLSLITNDATATAITQTAALSVSNLAVQSVGGVSLTQGNDVTALAGNVTGTVPSHFDYTDANGFAVGTVDGIVGISTNLITAGTRIQLTANGVVTQSAGANLSTLNLLLSGGGSYVLDNAGNGAVTLAASASGTISYTDKDDLIVGSIVGSGSTVSGVTSNTAIALTTVNGNLTVTNTNAGVDIQASGGTVSLTAGTAVGTDKLLDIQANAAVNGTGGVTLTADNIIIAATINAGTSTAVLRQFENATLIDLGGADAANTLGLTDAELDLVTAGVIRIGNANAGDITITAAINTANTNQLELVTGGGIVDGLVGGNITEALLGLTAVTGIGIFNALDTSVSNLEATTATGGIFVFNVGGLTIGGVNATLTGVRTTTSGSISVQNNSDITVSEAISAAGGGMISLSTTNSNININAAISATGGNGNVNIFAEDDITVTQAVSVAGTGTLLIDADSPTDGVGDFSNSGAGTLTTAGGNITIRAQDVDLGANVSTTSTAATSRVIIVPDDAGDIITLGADTVGALGLTDADLDRVTTGILQIGTTATSGAGISIVGQITQAGSGYTTLLLETQGAITDNTAGEQDDITVQSLALSADTGIGAAGNGDIDIAVTNLAALNTSATTGIINVTNSATPLNIATVDGFSGVVNNNANAATGVVTVATTGALNVNRNVTAAAGGTGPIALTAGGAINVAASTIVQSGNSTAGGAITLTSNATVNGVVQTTGTADITLGAGAQILTRSDITLDAKPAGVGANFGGGIVMDPASVLAGPTATLANNITLNAGKDITVSTLSATTQILVTTTKNIFDDNAENTALSANLINLNSGGVIGGQNIITPANVLAQTAAPGTTPFTGAIDFDLTGVTPILTVVQTAPGNVQLRKVGSTGLTRSTLNLAAAIVGSTNQLALISSAGDLTIDALLNTPTNLDTLLATTGSGANSIVFSGAGQVNNGTPAATTNLVATGSATAGISDSLSGDNTPEVTSTNGVLITTGGAIGAGGSPLEFNFGLLNGFTNGNAAATGGNAFLTDTANGLAVGQFSAAGTTTAGNVTLASRGNNGGTGLNLTAVTSNDNVAEVIGNVVTLDTSAAPTNGATGQIGSFSGTPQFFEVNATVLNASTNNSRLWVSEVGTGATAGAQIGLVTAGTDTAILQVRNAGNLTSEPSDAGVADVVGATVILIAPEGGNFGSAGSALEINATAALTATVTGTGLINVTDTAGGLPSATASTGTGNITLSATAGALVVTSATATVSGNIALSTTTNGSITVVKATTAAGSFAATSAADVILGTGASTNPVVTATTTATVTAVGAVSSGATGAVTDVTAASLAATAGTGVGTVGTPLETTVANFEATTTTGGVFLSNTGALFIGGASGLLTGVSAAGGNIIVTSSTGLTVTEAVSNTGGGNVALTATANNLAVNAAVAATGGNGTVALIAAGNVALTAAVTAVGAGTITAMADSDDNGSGDFTSTAPGTVATTTGAIAISGISTTVGGNVTSSGAGLITLTARETIALTDTLTVNAGTTVSTTGSTINLNAGDAAILNGTFSTAAAGMINVLVDQGAADVGVGGTVTTSATTVVNGATSVVITGGADADTFTLRPFATAVITLTGANPTTLPGDTLNLDLTGTTTPTLTPTNPSGGGFTFGNRGTVDYNTIEAIVTTGAPLALVLDLVALGFQNGSPNPDVVSLSTTAGGVLNATVQNNSTGTPLSFFSGLASSVSSITVIGSSDSETFRIDETQPGLPPITVQGNTQTSGPGDALAINFTNATGTAFASGAPGAGTYTFGNRASIDFTGIEIAPALVTIAATDPTAGERGFFESADPGLFTLTRVGILTAALSVNFTVGGTARNGIDFAPISGTATFLAGSSTVTISVDAKNNSLVDGTRTVVLTLVPGAGYTLPAGAAATVSILDNDRIFVGTVTSSAGGTSSDVRIFGADPAGPFTSIPPFIGFTGGIVVAVGDVNGDGVADIGAAVAADGAPHVKIFDGVTGAELLSFFAFDTAYIGGLSLAIADLDGDGLAEIIVGASKGVSHVKVFNGITGAELNSFYAYTDANGAPTPSGVSVAAGDLDGDGKAEIVTGASSIAPHVKVFNGTGAVLQSYFAFDANKFTGGISVAVGDLNGDGKAEIAAGVNASGISLVNVFYNNGEIRGPVAVPANKNPGLAIRAGQLIVSSGPKLSFFDGVSLGLIGDVIPYSNYLGDVFVGA